MLYLEGGGGTSTVIVIFCVLFGQCSVGWSNDWLDAGRDLRANRLEKPVVRGIVSADLLQKLAVLAGVASLVCAVALGWRALLVDALALGVAWSYNAGIKGTILSPLPYAISFSLLPAFVTVSLPGHLWPQPLAMGGAACLGLGAHFINTLKDADADQQTGVRGLPQRLGPQWSTIFGVAFLLAALAAIIGFEQRLTPLTVIALVTSLAADAMVVWSALRHHENASWRWTIVSAAACVALFASSGSALVR